MSHGEPFAQKINNQRVFESEPIATVSFDRFDLDTFPFKEVPVSELSKLYPNSYTERPAGQQAWISEGKIQVGTQILKIKCIKQEYSAFADPTQPLVCTYYDYFLYRNEEPSPVLHGFLSYDYGEIEGDKFKKYAYPIVRTVIEKNSAHKDQEELRGIGMKFALKAFEWFEKRAAQGEKFILEFWHDETMGLSRKKWDEVIGSVLENKGAIRLEAGHWALPANINDFDKAMLE